MFPGVLSVAYILVFVAVKAGIWGFHMNFSSVDPEVGVPGNYSWSSRSLSWLKEDTTVALLLFVPKMHSLLVELTWNMIYVICRRRCLTLQRAEVSAGYTWPSRSNLHF